MLVNEPRTKARDIYDWEPKGWTVSNLATFKLRKRNHND